MPTLSAISDTQNEKYKSISQNPHISHGIKQDASIPKVHLLV